MFVVDVRETVEVVSVRDELVSVWVVFVADVEDTVADDEVSDEDVPTWQIKNKALASEPQGTQRNTQAKHSKQTERLAVKANQRKSQEHERTRD